MTPMSSVKPKSVASPPTQPAERTQDKPSRRTFGLPGDTRERAERRHALMDEHRETLRRLGE